MSNQIDPIVSEARVLNQKFEEMIEPYRQSLWNYCKYISGSPWDGDDLFQETLLKAFATMSQLWHPLKPKSYIFRIATNSWIDTLRKKKIDIDTYQDDLHNENTCESMDPHVIIEALELLAYHLVPRQIAVILLMDVFQFTAKEVAGMVRITEGAVYSALHRARENIGARKKSVNKKGKDSNNTDQNNTLLNALLNIMKDGDSSKIVELLSDSVHNDANPGFQEYSKDDMINGSFAYKGPIQNVSVENLWGKTVFVVKVDTEQGEVLHDIREFQIDNGRIVAHRGYYFCKELLFEAGRVLNIPVQLIKVPGINWGQDLLS
ncbi:RNA polymerase sigma factor [Paenibacillus sp. GP183]|jgi:RNA polymerase sigma factor (sigma-70 family)|uniref:RNA polymerase sigma factor n=1 Tax=Paenibacillus sp. GP183 TaxID=1882751 RepID=UPI00089C429D|nr:RNA polymerase sigma factor [Paenibacillus sp. GP183]SEB49483.1 RNA polymerase sigma-70 factor, ECF subfamily [Paenibacillus sp. GP183]